MHGLMKATNYSIRVLAFTSTGDGLHSIPIYCTTDEDVPEAPANIKASALTAESILISWLPPIQRNGMIIHYTVYSKESDRKGQTRSEWDFMRIFFMFVSVIFMMIRCFFVDTLKLSWLLESFSDENDKIT